jgi:predicted RNA-binding Zn-ribbon protein involved in translation (DUF1610 family)
MSDNIPCPNCQTLISINTEEFLKGKSFSCSNCDVKIGMTEKTDLDQAKMDLFKKFTKIKKEKTSSLPCPDCGIEIPFLTKDLMKGNKIVCPSCKATMELKG